MRISFSLLVAGVLNSLSLLMVRVMEVRAGLPEADRFSSGGVYHLMLVISLAVTSLVATMAAYLLWEGDAQTQGWEASDAREEKK
jgi:hypothetical protein